jgi:Ni/Co efflux regulator RcnB
MKTLLIATVAAFAFAGTGIASAQTSVGSDVDLNARNTTHVGTKAHVKRHRSTTGAGVSTGIETRDNNASARGSLLPGKDRLNSEHVIKDRR